VYAECRQVLYPYHGCCERWINTIQYNTRGAPPLAWLHKWQFIFFLKQSYVNCICWQPWTRFWQTIHRLHVVLVLLLRIFLFPQSGGTNVTASWGTTVACMYRPGPRMHCGCAQPVAAKWTGRYWRLMSKQLDGAAPVSTVVTFTSICLGSPMMPSVVQTTGSVLYQAPGSCDCCIDVSDHLSWLDSFPFLGVQSVVVLSYRFAEHILRRRKCWSSSCLLVVLVLFNLSVLTGSL
jgi:hypothetical protein